MLQDNLPQLRGPLARRFGPPPNDPTTALARFVADHATGLRTAADLLGGERHARALDEIVDALAHDPQPSRRTLNQLDELLMLLSLELVTDLDSPEAQAFGLIDPADPVVEQICLVTDGLRGAMGAYWRALDTTNTPRELGRAA